MSDDSTDRLEAYLGRLLHGGVLSSAACLAAGLAIWTYGGFPGVATFLLTAGLMILMATPILRVVVSLIEYARLRDWFFVATTLFVFGVLVVTLTLALRQAS
jgi:acyl-coenzyme A thioesterase PaaI-like protein